jgi:hypothetical protein
MYRRCLEHARIANAAGRAVRSVILLGIFAVWTPGPASAEMRHPSFPEALRGVWARIGDQCGDDSTPRLIITEKRVTWPNGECAVDYVAERPGPRGAIYSGRGSCVDRAGQTFETLAQYQRCGQTP